MEIRLDTMMNYKGFSGTVEFSEEDGVFHGQIEGIDGLVTYEADSEDELKKSFEEAVEDYLQFCHEEEIKEKSSVSAIAVDS